MIDVEIEYHPARYSYTNVRPKWLLPKRPGVASLFYEQGTTSGRVSASGLLSFVVSQANELLDLRIPDDRAIISSSLFDHGYGYISNRKLSKRCEFGEIQTSDKGRYLRGIVELFGSLFHAQQFLGDPFWREVTYLLAGRTETKKATEIRESLVRKVIDETLQSTQGQLPDFGSLAKALASALTFRDIEGGESRTFTELKSLLPQVRHDALKTAANSDYWKHEVKFDAARESEFHSHLSQNIFIQGQNIQCPNCLTTQWRGVGDLSSKIECESCLSVFQLSHKSEWAFRLNALIGNAIRYHGVLPVINALEAIERKSPFGTMICLPCQNLFRETTNASDWGPQMTFRHGALQLDFGMAISDLDLILIRDSRVVIGEVKSTPAGFNQENLKQLVRIALELKPDDVILAAEGSEWPVSFQELIAPHRSALHAQEIELECLLLSPQI